jgi:hypothetical protein
MLLALDYQPPSMVANGGNSEKTRMSSKRKKKTLILPIWMLATITNVLENYRSESRASVLFNPRFLIPTKLSDDEVERASFLRS